eukprot:TRINITY_DN46_c0_g1_i1.p1 TRINITY_DN46_c0_g1~~TRINITY_DN46_c0_g1_i1.p1  ORF type:complete len:146 (-),score=20.70 TRINITY_DN46_c0_g1_i1:188-625(-)
MAAAIDQQLVGTAAGFHHVSMLIDNDEDWELNDSVHARRMSFAPRARGVSLLEEDVGLHGHFDLDQMFFAKIADEESGSDFDSIADDYIQEHDIASVVRPPCCCPVPCSPYSVRVRVCVCVGPRPAPCTSGICRGSDLVTGLIRG